MKETLELIKALELVAVKGIEIAKGGIDATDISKALELIKQFDVIVEGVKGLDKIDDEVKAIDQAKLIEAGVAVFGLVKAIKEASAKADVA